MLTIATLVCRSISKFYNWDSRLTIACCTCSSAQLCRLYCWLVVYDTVERFNFHEAPTPQNVHAIWFIIKNIKMSADNRFFPLLNRERSVKYVLKNTVVYIRCAFSRTSHKYINDLLAWAIVKTDMVYLVLIKKQMQSAIRVQAYISMDLRWVNPAAHLQCSPGRCRLPTAYFTNFAKEAIHKLVYLFFSFNK